MEDERKTQSSNWTTAVEDLMDGGDLDGAISLLESLVITLESAGRCGGPNLELASALSDLANLYSFKGFSLKSDDLLSRASLIRLRSQHSPSSPSDLETANRESKKEEGMFPQNDGLVSTSSSHEGGLCDGKTTNAPHDALQEPGNGSSDDDWEAIADRAPEELVASQCLPGFSNLSLEDAKIPTLNRRGRGTFSYKKDDLYSDRLSDGSVTSVEETVYHKSDCNVETGYSKYGTQHVLILADLPATTQTMDLEKLFENFRDLGVSIRWVNDTIALAVFRTPSIVHILDEADPLIGSIPARDLDPPRPRPQTSARTATRLIAQGMGLKLPSPNFGSTELRKQEEARRNRIITRKIMKDDAWGADDSN